MHTGAQTHACIHTNKRVHTHIHTHANEYTNIHTQTCTQFIHTHAHTHTLTHTHTHIHTHRTPDLSTPQDQQFHVAYDPCASMSGMAGEDEASRSPAPSPHRLQKRPRAIIGERDDGF